MQRTKRVAGLGGGGAGAALSAAYLVVAIGASGAGSGSVRLDDGWLLATGDDAGWAAPELVEDNDWRPIQVGMPWEACGFEGYDGFAWYRVRFVVPESWRQGADITGSGEGLILDLGPVDDVDETFLNGVRVGRTGGMPPAYDTAYAVERVYPIPAEVVRWGGTNVLAVRVFDGEEPGGIYRGPVVVRPPLRSDFLDITLHPKSPDGIYASPGPILVSCSVSNRLPAPASLVVEAALCSDQVLAPSVLERTRIEIEVAGGEACTTSLIFRVATPGFYRIVGELYAGEDVTKTASMIVGYAPEKIATPLTRLPDFEKFWEDRKRELAAVEPAFQITPSDASTDQQAVYLVEMRSYGGVTIRGWYTRPRSPGPHPAVLHVPGYTGTMEPVLHWPEVAHLALNPRGHGNSKDDLDPGDEEYMFLGFDPERPEEYVYAGAYLDCVRAIEFLESRPEIDGARIGVEGGSQGGGLSFATAALHPGIVGCAPDIPWLGDWVGYLECTTWPNQRYAELQERFPGLSHAEINAHLGYFDTMNMAGWIQCPVLMSVGLQDDVCPPRTAFGTYNQLSVPKTYRAYPFMGHQVPEAHYRLKRQWMNRRLGVQAGTGQGPSP